jgi:hypothetical protein
MLIRLSRQRTKSGEQESKIRNGLMQWCILSAAVEKPILGGTIAETCNTFWLPTREKAIVNSYLRAFGAFPSNLVVRVSAAMVDSAAPAGYDHTSTVHNSATPEGFACPASKQGNKCMECRACWNRDIKNVSYLQH